MNITFHKADLNDIQTLIDTRIRFALELTGKQSQEAIDQLKTEMKNYFLKAMPDNSCISFIARCDDKLAGSGSVQIREQPGNFKNPSGKWGYIMSMYTLPEFRRKGICKGILSALIKEAQQMGITAFELHATEAGELVYTQNGFERHVEPTLRRYI